LKELNRIPFTDAARQTRWDLRNRLEQTQREAAAVMKILQGNRMNSVLLEVFFPSVDDFTSVPGVCRLQLAPVY
jgi:hypothetical protein